MAHVSIPQRLVHALRPGIDVWLGGFQPALDKTNPKDP